MSPHRAGSFSGGGGVMLTMIFPISVSQVSGITVVSQHAQLQILVLIEGLQKLDHNKTKQNPDCGALTPRFCYRRPGMGPSHLHFEQLPHDVEAAGLRLQFEKHCSRPLISLMKW
jgi:hypothetical protein